MSISIASQGIQDLADLTLQTANPPKSGFAEIATQVSDALRGADKLAAGYAEGTVGLTDAVLASEKADVAFQVTIAARNRALAAYEQIMNIQV